MSSLESTPIMPDEELPPTEPAPTEVAEAEPQRESAETVAELLDAWKADYEQAEGDQKQELAYRIVKLGEAISFSGLQASDVKIRESEPGVLGFYVPSTGEVAITPAGLALPPEHFAHVLVHEATHAGVTLGKLIGDEGLTEIATKQKISNAMHGIYEQQQGDVRASFSTLGINRVLEVYDFDKPRELLELYLQTEWADQWKNKWSQEAPIAVLVTEADRKTFIENYAHTWTEQIEKNFETAAPRLFAKAEAEGFDFAAEHLRILTDLAEARLTEE